MPVTNVSKDLDARTLVISAEFAATPQRVWDLYADPRQIEKVFGPPTYPATFVDHELRTGARSTYYMTSPEGEKFAGVWHITDVDEPRSFSFRDAFADENFVENDSMPVSESTYAFEAGGAGTKATFTSTYATVEALQQVLDMGVEEGATAAINQIDDFLANA